MKEILQKVCDEFYLGTLQSFEQIEEGVLNVNYKIETVMGIFFIKTMRVKKQDSIETIYKTERYLKSFGIPVITMLLSKNNNYFVKIEDKSFCVYNFISSDRSHKYSEQDYFRMGEMLAKIHLVTKDNLPDFEIRQIKNPPKEEILLNLQYFKKKIEDKEISDYLDKKFLDGIKLKIKTLESLNYNDNIYDHKEHLLHGDYQTGNLLIDKDNREIIGICDLEKSELGSRAYEIARSLFCIVNFREEQDLKYIKFFIDGYNSKYPITEKEIIEGFEYRLSRQVKSKWIETMYYENNDSRANHFIDYEKFLVEFSMTDWKEKINKYLK